MRTCVAATRERLQEEGVPAREALLQATEKPDLVPTLPCGCCEHCGCDGYCRKGK